MHLLRLDSRRFGLGALMLVAVMFLSLGSLQAQETEQEEPFLDGALATHRRTSLIACTWLAARAFPEVLSHQDQCRWAGESLHAHPGTTRS